MAPRGDDIGRGNLFTNSSTTHCVASWPGLPIAVMMMGKSVECLRTPKRSHFRFDVVGVAHFSARGRVKSFFNIF